MKATTRNRLAWGSVAAGVSIIFGGCVVSIAMRNPGGPVVSVGAAEQAIRIAYVACAIGGVIAVGVPAALVWGGRGR